VVKHSLVIVLICGLKVSSVLEDIEKTYEIGGSDGKKLFHNDS